VTESTKSNNKRRRDRILFIIHLDQWEPCMTKEWIRQKTFKVDFHLWWTHDAVVILIDPDSREPRRKWKNKKVE